MYNNSIAHVFRELNSKTELFWSFMGLNVKTMASGFQATINLLLLFYSNINFLVCAHPFECPFENVLQRCMHAYYSVECRTNKSAQCPENDICGGRRAFFQLKPHISIEASAHFRFNLDGDWNGNRTASKTILCHCIAAPLARKFVFHFANSGHTLPISPDLFPCSLSLFGAQNKI